MFIVNSVLDVYIGTYLSHTGRDDDVLQQLSLARSLLHSITRPQVAQRMPKEMKLHPKDKTLKNVSVINIYIIFFTAINIRSRTL